MQFRSEDFLQDVAFDFYGNKMAVCSSDRKIRIYDKSSKSEDWKEVVNWEAHDAPVWKIQWAHPEFGVLLASCGFDKRVNIWQEKVEGGDKNWVPKAKIQDFSDSVEDISFCPKVYGLKLAATTLNGKMKIFEPTDYANNINWNCIAHREVSTVGCSSVCWNPSILDPLSLVVGCYYDEKKNNKDELVQIFAVDSKKEYSLVAKLVDEGHTNSITDVEWAPQFGRSFHLIGTCSIDKRLIIWKIELKFDQINDNFENISVRYSKLYTYDNKSEFWRLSWNLSGTLISVIDGEGNTSVFKKIDDKHFEKLQLADN